jgi:hypothetical protein
MAQTIKFVYEDGKVRLQNTSIDLTKEVIKTLQHDYRAKYFVLTDGQFAPEPHKRKKYGFSKK